MTTSSPKEAIEALRALGVRITPQRLAIVTEIMTIEGHIAPQEVAQRVRAKVPGVNDSTVYRTLELLEDLGLITHAHLGAGPEYHRVGEHDHVHLVCERCGAQDELTAQETQPLRRLIHRHSGFLPDFTHFAISGLCSRCQEVGRSL